MSGADSNDGLSQAKSWQTLAKVSSSATPGARVLYAPGDYRGKLIIPGPGVHEALDAQTPPTFWGSDILPSSGWSVSGIGANCYELVTASLNWVLGDHLFLERTTSTAECAALAGSWFWSGGTLYVNVPANPNSSGVVYSACRREDVIHTNSKNYVTVRNINVRETALLNGGYGVRVEGSVGVLLEGIDARECGKHAIGVISASATVRRCSGGYMAPGQGFGGATTFVHYASSGAFETTWEDCESDTGDDSSYPAFIVHGEGVARVQITRMVANGYGLSLLPEDADARVTVSDSTFSNGTNYIAGVGTMIERCSFAGENSTISIVGTDTVLDGVTAGVDVEPSWQAGRPGFIIDEGTRTVIRNCMLTLDRSNAGCISARNACNAPSWTGNTLRNISGPIVWALLDAIPGLVSDNNTFTDAAPTFTFAGGVTTTYTKAQWQALGYDVSSSFG